MRLSTKGGLDLWNTQGDQTQSHVEPTALTPDSYPSGYLGTSLPPPTPESKSDEALGPPFLTLVTHLGFLTLALPTVEARQFFAVGGCPGH